MLTAEKPKSTMAVTVVGIITLILALGFVCVFLVAPSVYGFIISFFRYEIIRGIGGSPWVGLQNYLQVLGNERFLSALGWTFTFSAAGAAALFALSLAAGYLLLAAGKIRWLRHALCTLLLLPIAVPGELWAQAFVALFGAEAIRTAWIMAAWCALRYVGLPSLLVTAALSHGKRGAAVPVMAGGIAAIVMFTTLGRTDFGFLWTLSGSGVHSLDVYEFRMFLMNMQIGAGVAAQFVRSLIQAVLMAAAAFPVAILLKRLFPKASEPNPARIRDRLVALAPAGAVALLALAAMLAVSLFGGAGSAALNLIPNAAIYTVLALVTAFVNTALCFLLAWPAACGGRAGKPAMTAVLILLTAMSMAALPMGEFLVFRSAGMLNTWFAVGLSGIACVWGVWPLVFAAKSQGLTTSADWFRRMWKPALALFAAQAALQMNNTLPSMIYMSQADRLHPLAAVQRLMSGFANRGEDAAFIIGFVAAIMLVVPVALLLIARTVFDEKDNLAVFMPGK